MMNNSTPAYIADNCTCANVSRVARVVTQLFDETLRPSGLSTGQFTIMVGLAVAGEATIAPMAARLMMDRTTLTRNLRPLQRKGLVEIARGIDQRQRVIRLTAQGHQALDAAIPLWEVSQQRVVEFLGPDHWQAFMGQLTDVAAITANK